jgi:hypothetical protein
MVERAGDQEVLPRRFRIGDGADHADAGGLPESASGSLVVAFARNVIGDRLAAFERNNPRC